MMYFLKLIVNMLLWGVSFLIPNSKNIIVVGGWQGKRYADNSRGMFEYLDEHRKELGLKHVFWFTYSSTIRERLQEEGKEVLYGFTPKSIFWHYRAGVHFIDQNTRDILSWFSMRAIRINLWHGIPLKKIGVDIIHKANEKPYWLRKYSSAGFWVDQYILAPSECAGKLLTHAMDVKMDHCIIASYPRNNRLYDHKYIKGEKRTPFVAYYLPTFRASGKKCPLVEANLNEINKELAKADIELWVKPHFASMADWSIVDNFSNIKVLDSKEDVYEGLCNADLLITDYSSVYFDFLITERPIIFYPYDLQEYENHDRGFYMPYEESTPGDKVYSVGDLIDKLIYIRNDTDGYVNKYFKKYNSVLRKMNKYYDSPNYDAIIQLMQK